MKIEIWSDIMCPFCYIGKEKFEKALSSFSEGEKIEVEYKSFQLDPNYKHKEGDTVLSYLSETKGMPVEQIEGMAQHISQSAREAGIEIDFKKNIPANTFDAHRLIYLAKEEGKEKEIVEALFKAHFTEGENIEDKEVLKALGRKAGIAEEKLDQTFSSEDFSYEVNQDIMESRNLGISGVPFFLFDRKYAVSGAQPVEAFEEAIQKSFQNWRKENPAFENLSSSEGGVCSDGACEV